MRTSRDLMSLLVVTALALAAGRPGGPAREEAAASGQSGPEQQEAAEMRAFIEAGTPGEPHRDLDQLLGEWTGEFKIWRGRDAAPMISRGTVRREWILGGRFLREQVEAETEEGPFRGLGLVGYNNFDRQYEMVWMDTMSTAMYTEVGTYHRDRKILHTRGSQRDPATGRVMNFWGKMNLADPDRHTYVGYTTDADAREYKAMEIVLQKVGPH